MCHHIDFLSTLIFYHIEFRDISGQMDKQFHKVVLSHHSNEVPFPFHKLDGHNKEDFCCAVGNHNCNTLSSNRIHSPCLARMNHCVCSSFLSSTTKRKQNFQKHEFCTKLNMGPVIFTIFFLRILRWTRMLLPSLSRHSLFVRHLGGKVEDRILLG